MKKIHLFLLSIAFASCQESVSVGTGVDDFYFVEHAGVTMPVWVRGNTASGAMVLVVHGGPGGEAMASYNSTAMAPIEAQYGVAYWDQRGGGSSQGGRNQDQVTLQTFSEDLHYVIQSLRLRYGQDLDVFLYAHSWGGMLSTDYFLRYGDTDRISGWFFLDGAFDFPMTLSRSKAYTEEIARERINAGDREKEWQEIIDFLSVREHGRSVKESLEINQYAWKGILLLDSLIADADNEPNFGRFGNPNNYLSGQMNMMGILHNEKFMSEVLSTAHTSRLHEIAVPALIVFGKYDLVIPPDLGDTLFQHLGSTEKRFVVLENSSHALMDNEPEKLNPEILTFIESHR
jgi:pimeloyl-ACP methyl ester carboxylesterase